MNLTSITTTATTLPTAGAPQRNASDGGGANAFKNLLNQPMISEDTQLLHNESVTTGNGVKISGINLPDDYGKNVQNSGHGEPVDTDLSEIKVSGSINNALPLNIDPILASPPLSPLPEMGDDNMIDEFLGSVNLHNPVKLGTTQAILEPLGNNNLYADKPSLSVSADVVATTNALQSNAAMNVGGIETTSLPSQLNSDLNSVIPFEIGKVVGVQPAVLPVSTVESSISPAIATNGVSSVVDGVRKSNQAIVIPIDNKISKSGQIVEDIIGKLVIDKKSENSAVVLNVKPQVVNSNSLISTQNISTQGQNGDLLLPKVEVQPVQLVGVDATRLNVTGETQFQAAKVVNGQILHEVVKTSLKPGGKLVIKLTPSELGRVEVTLMKTATGNSVRVMVDRAETLDLIRMDIRSLERSLQEIGMDIKSGSINLLMRGSEQNEGNSFIHGNNKRHSNNQNFETDTEFREQNNQRRLPAGRGSILNISV